MQTELNVSFHETFYKNLCLPDPPDEILATVAEVLKQAVQNIIGDLPSFIVRFDVVADGHCAQITPLVMPEGVVVRLDLSIVIFNFWVGIDDQKKDLLRSIVFHEVFHLHDRMNRDFKMDYHEDSLRAAEPLRTSANAVWDVSIERRKLDSFDIHPFVKLLSNPPQADPRKAVADNLRSSFEDISVIDEIMEEVWDKSRGHVDHPRILELAKKLKPKTK